MNRLFKNSFLLPVFLTLFFLFSLTGCSIGVSDLQASHTEQPKTSASDLQVHFIDVGQGDSILLQSDGHSMLIDAGENDQGTVVVDYLKQNHISKLDYVIGTHPHSDHIGGLDDVIRAFDVKTVILPPIEHTTKTFEDVLDAVSDRGLKLTKPVVGTEYTLGNAVFQIIAPNKDYGNDLNNWSVGIKCTYGSTSFVMCGDAEAKSEADIVKNGLDLSADVLKLGHHGSRTSTSDAFFNAVHPNYAVISCGKGNDYGHPHKETMKKLEAAGISILRTDESGTLIAVSDGRSIEWSSQKGTAAEQAKKPAAKPEKTKKTEYILNTNSKKFHLPDCSSIGQISSQNKKSYNGSREELISKGYTPCKSCNP